MLTKVPQGTVIISEGEASMDMYKIVSGHVELYTGYGTPNESVLGIKSKNDYFGEMGLLTEGKPAIYTVVAYSDVLILRITSADIDEYIQQNHVDALRLMKHLADSMYALKFSMDLLLKDMAERENDNNAQLKEFSGFYSKMFSKYNAGNMMDSSSKYIDASNKRDAGLNKR